MPNKPTKPTKRVFLLSEDAVEAHDTALQKMAEIVDSLTELAIGPEDREDFADIRRGCLGLQINNGRTKSVTVPADAKTDPDPVPTVGGTLHRIH